MILTGAYISQVKTLKIVASPRLGFISGVLTTASLPCHAPMRVGLEYESERLFEMG